MNYNIIFPTAFDSINPDNDNMDMAVSMQYCINKIKF